MTNLSPPLTSDRRLPKPKRPMFTPERQRRVAALPRGAHPPHPLCGACGNAVYKSMTSQRVTWRDKWAYCRNPACPRYGVRLE